MKKETKMKNNIKGNVEEAADTIACSVYDLTNSICPKNAAAGTDAADGSRAADDDAAGACGGAHGTGDRPAADRSSTANPESAGAARAERSRTDATCGCSRRRAAAARRETTADATPRARHQEEEPIQRRRAEAAVHLHHEGRQLA